MKNIIIFTTGSSGSSVLAGLMGKKYWLGDETKKLKFDTYENAELVDLNIKLLNEIKYGRRDCNDIPPPSVDSIVNLYDSVDLTEYKAFVDKSMNHFPWLWKDPRLSYTIHFWSRLLPVEEFKYIFIDRDPRQSYAGLILNRKIPMSFGEQVKMNNNYKKSVDVFMEKHALGMMTCTFEEMILNPRLFFQRLNTFVDCDFDISDLLSVYKGELHKKRYSNTDYLKARINYFIHHYVIRDQIRFPRIIT